MRQVVGRVFGVPKVAPTARLPPHRPPPAVRALSTASNVRETVSVSIPMLPPHERPQLSVDENIALRRRHLAPALKAHYMNAPAGPLKPVMGRGQYLYDAHGTQYLDLVNNVCHVGHCHPRLVEAASTQLGKLNTNARYLHDNIVRLSDELVARFPSSLTTVYFCNSGTEANDLALRLARNHTMRKDVACVDGAYHGNSTATLAISPCKHCTPCPPSLTPS